jgi:hypothetical protein
VSAPATTRTPPETAGWAIAERAAKLGTAIGPAFEIIHLVHRAFVLGGYPAQDVPAIIDGAIRFHREVIADLEKTRADVCASQADAAEALKSQPKGSA